MKEERIQGIALIILVIVYLCILFIMWIFSKIPKF